MLIVKCSNCGQVFYIREKIENDASAIINLQYTMQTIKKCPRCGAPIRRVKKIKLNGEQVFP